MKARTIRRRRNIRPCAARENLAMARRAREKQWRLTDRYERRIPHQCTELEDWDE